MSEYKPLLGIYYGELDKETKQKLEYYEKHKKKEIEPILDKLMKIFMALIAFPSFFWITVNGGRKVSAWGIGNFLSILIGLIAWIVIIGVGGFLIINAVLKYADKHDEQVEQDNDVFTRW